MEQVRKRGLPHAQKVGLWRRWKGGQTLAEIGLALGKHAASIRGMLVVSGGIAPLERTRSHPALNDGLRNVQRRTRRMETRVRSSANRAGECFNGRHDQPAYGGAARSRPRNTLERIPSVHCRWADGGRVVLSACALSTRLAFQYHSMHGVPLWCAHSGTATKGSKS
jgi:hypothetical protein